MALQFMCSCGDHLADADMLQKWDVYNDTFVTASGYNSTKAFDSGISVYSRPRCVKRVTLSPVNEVVFGFRVYAAAGTFPISGAWTYVALAAVHYAGASAFSFATKQLSLNVETDGKLSLKRGGGSGTLLATSAATCLANDTWTYVEVHAKVDNTQGSVTVYADNVAVISVTGIDTQALSAASIDGVEFVPWRIDDVYICDRTATAANPYVSPFGKGFHVMVNRTSADSTVQWTPASGTNEDCIDDATPDGTQNSAAFAGKQDLFTMAALSSSVDRIYAVQSNLIAKKSASSSGATLADVCQMDGTDIVATAQSLDTALTDKRTIYATTPDDHREWDYATYNATLRGYRRVA